MSTHSLEIALNVSDIPASGASRILRWFIDHVVNQPIPVENPSVYNLKADNFSTFFKDIHGRWGHGPGKDASYVGMVATGSGEKNNFF